MNPVSGVARMNIASVLAVELGERLAANYSGIFGHARPELADLLRTMAYIGIERIANTDALYHDADHTILVTMVGQAILKGRILVERVTADDWLHFTTATLVHDIGYLRGICPGDEDGRYVINEAGDLLALPRGASDAALAPYHVDRAKIFVRHRLKATPGLDVERIACGIEHTRFPVPCDDDYQDTADEPGLVRAADLIGQLGDPFYPSKLNALFYEFTEIGIAQERGYDSPADLARDTTRASSGAASSPTSRTRSAISIAPRKARCGWPSSTATSSWKSTPATATAPNAPTTPAPATPRSPPPEPPGAAPHDRPLALPAAIDLPDELAELARRDPTAPALKPLAEILAKHHATLKSQYDAFADYVAEAERQGVDNYPLPMDQGHDRPARQTAKIPEILHPLHRRRRGVSAGQGRRPGSRPPPPVAGPLLTHIAKHDTNPANNPQMPARYRK